MDVKFIISSKDCIETQVKAFTSKNVSKSEAHIYFEGLSKTLTQNIEVKRFEGGENIF